MKVLIACEYSGTVRDAFIAKGHDATSCDLLPSDRPGPHHQGDVRDILGDGWDLMIAHPDCTYLCSSGLHWNKRPEGIKEGRAAKTEKALTFVAMLMDANHIPKIAIENPVGCISTRIKPYSQKITPWAFGHDASKTTCLWLKGLPLLKPTLTVYPRAVCCGETINPAKPPYVCRLCKGIEKPKARWGNQTNSGQNRLGPSDDRGKIRSLTYQG